MTMLLALLALQDASLDAFYKFKPGTGWTYARVENGEKRRVEAKVEGEENGRVKVDWKEINADGSTHSHSEIVWFVKDGVLRAEARSKESGDVFELPLLKAGAKKGDSWSNPEGESSCLDVGELKVAAGAYKDAVHVRLNAGSADAPVPIHFHFAPKVGLLKLTIGPDAGLNSFELSEFKEPK